MTIPKKYSKINRVEIISQEKREIVLEKIEVKDILLQDEGKTLKIFIKK